MFFSSKARIQDRQRHPHSVAKSYVEHVSFTLSDQVNGPFSFELDSIGVQVDHSHKEESAYEEYEIYRGMAAKG